MTKPFDRTLFAQYDAVARACGLMHLISQPTVNACWNNIKKYGEDLLYTFSPNGSQGGLECEVKTLWAGGAFPYTEVQVLERKTKYFKKGIDLILISKNMQDYMIIPHSVILSSPQKPIRNRYNISGEMFYIVPLDNVTIKKFTCPITVEQVFCCGELYLERINERQFSCNACQVTISKDEGLDSTKSN